MITTTARHKSVGLKYGRVVEADVCSYMIGAPSRVGAPLTWSNL